MSARKAQAVLDILAERLQEFRVEWTDVTAVELYTVHNVHPLLETDILPPLASGGITACAGTTPVRRSPRSRSEMGAQAIYQELVLRGS